MLDGWSTEIIRQAATAACDEVGATAREARRPCVLHRPTLTLDGNAWLAILGDLPTGVVGCGDTPEEAMADFDKAFCARGKVTAK